MLIKGFFPDYRALKDKPSIPLSCYEGCKVGVLLEKILNFHVKSGNKILDPTCGKRYIWEGFVEFHKWAIVYSDIKDFGYNLVCDFRDLKFDFKFDGIVFDPPYFFGVDNSDDRREEDYGGYAHSYEELCNLMEQARDKFQQLLKDEGVLILKCQDMFHVKTRKFYPLHIIWVNLFSNTYCLKDIFIYKYHRVSPTAYQVKDRPCNIINHTYFLVFQKNI